MKIISRLLLLPLVAAMMSIFTIVPAQAWQIVKASECVINFNASTYWGGVGRPDGVSLTTDLWMQVASLHDSLSEKCKQRACNFTNIDPGLFMNLMNPAFAPSVPQQLRDEFTKCRIGVNDFLSIASTGGGSGSGGSGSSCSTSMSIKGTDISVNGSSVGCNTLGLVIAGSHIRVWLDLVGHNDVGLYIVGDYIDFSASIWGSHTVSETVTSSGDLVLH